jgi:hypothetical protein
VRSLLFLLACACAAQDLPSAARELARKIAAKAPGDTISLTLHNNSSLDTAQIATVRRALEADPARRGSRTADVTVTLSENLRSYVWSAEIRRRDDRETAIVSIPKLPAPLDAPAGAITLERKLLREQDAPILDAYAAEGALLVLEPAAVAVYEAGQLRASAPIPEPHPVARDPRGKLEIQQDTFRAYLAGIVCRGVWRPSLVMQCAPGSDLWPIEGGPATLASGRNFFTRGSLPPYYSGAATDGLWVQASTDGRAQIFDASLRPIASINGWGSDIVAAGGSCPSAVLVTQPSGEDEPDSVQPVRIQNGRAIPAGDRLEFSGPVTAMWPGVIVIARNAKTGRYAAYSLAVTCSR